MFDYLSICPSIYSPIRSSPVPVRLYRTMLYLYERTRPWPFLLTSNLLIVGGPGTEGVVHFRAEAIDTDLLCRKVEGLYYSLFAPPVIHNLSSQSAGARSRSHCLLLDNETCLVCLVRQLNPDRSLPSS